MGRSRHRDIQGKLTGLLSAGLSAPLLELLPGILSIVSPLVRRLSNQGVYEVLDYVSTIEIKDCLGKRALFTKRERVRYKQDNIIAFQDQAWGDGEILRGYKCSPGVPVDVYRSGHKTHILISLREIKARGDEDEFNIRWGIRDGFTSSEGYWETEVEHHCQRIKMQVIYPKARPPLRLTFTEVRKKRDRTIEPRNLKQLPDGKWLLSWEVAFPRHGERYLIKWTW